MSTCRAFGHTLFSKCEHFESWLQSTIRNNTKPSYRIVWHAAQLCPSPYSTPRYGIGQLMLSRNMDPPDYSSAQPVAPTGFTRTPALHQSLSSIASSSDGVRTRSVLSDASTSERVLNVDSASVQAVDAAAEKAAGEWKARSRPTSARHWKARSGS